MISSHRREGMFGATVVFLVTSSLVGAQAQWDFNGNLESSTGQSALVALAAPPALNPEVNFGTAQLGGELAEVAHFSRGTYFEVPHGMHPNGGGTYINQFTLILDVMLPDRSPSGGIASLLQTNCCNQNDGDWFINLDSGIGVDGSFGGSVPDGQWHRLALAVDLVAGTFTSYVDGVQVQTLSGQALDGRFSIYSPTDGDPEPYKTFFVFADDSGQNAEGFVNSIQFHDLTLSPGVIAELGGPKAAGIPRDICLLPPAVVTRDIVPIRGPEETNGDFLPGDSISVKLALSDIRTANPPSPCVAPNGVVVVETLPAGWSPAQITDGGSHDPARSTITWTLLGANFAEGKRVSYRVTAAATPELGVTFVGTLVEDIPDARSSPIRGESTLLSEIPFDACGGIRCWNILGAYRQPFGASPGDSNLRLDYLTDGEVSEAEFVFLPGAQIATAFGGDGVTQAASTGIAGGTSGRNGNGVPTVFAWNDRDGTVNLNDDVFGGNPDSVMAYAQTYVVNTSGAPMEVHLGIASDDSVQVLLNGEEVWLHSIGRAGADACTPQDVSPDGVSFVQPHLLAPGENSLIVKVWEGGGDWGFALRFQSAAGEPITEGLEVRKLPAGVCPVAPLRATRTIDTGESVLVQCVERPKLSAGGRHDVVIVLSDVRAASPSCPDPAIVRIEEAVPPGWTPSDPSPGGVISGQSVSWTMTGDAIAGGILSYQLTAPVGTGNAAFRGRIEEPPSRALFAVDGDGVLANPAAFSEDGFVKSWLLLGPFQQPTLGGGPAPGAAAIRLDYLTDGAGIHERDVTPRHGDMVMTAFRGAAHSIGLADPVTPTPINPGGVPTWKAWRDLDDTIAFDDYYGGDLNQVLMYAVAYIAVAEDLTVDLGLASDDSIQVLLDGEEIHLNNVARPFDANGTVQELIAGVRLAAGIHRLMVKVFEGTGAHGFRLRFQDQLGEPVTQGIEICLDPECAPEASRAPSFHRGDADANGVVELTDAVRILGFLFLGANAPVCLDAADADDTGILELTDAIRILGYLFLGAPAPAAPGPPPQACGADPRAEDPDLGCESYPACFDEEADPNWHALKRHIKTAEDFCSWAEKLKADLEKWLMAIQGSDVYSEGYKKLIQDAIEAVAAAKANAFSDLEHSKFTADLALDRVYVFRVLTGLWASGATLMTIVISGLSPEGGDWCELLNAVLDFLGDMAKAVKDDGLAKKIESLKKAKALWKTLKDAKEAPEKIKQAYEDLVDAIMKLKELLLGH